MTAMHDSLVRERSSLFGAMCWMFGLTFLLTALLGWVPMVGPFIGPILGGYVGGRRAGNVGRAMLAAILPAILLTVLFLLIGALTGGLAGVPLLGAALAVFGSFAAVILVAHHVTLFAAALVGGLLAQTDPA